MSQLTDPLVGAAQQDYDQAADGAVDAFRGAFTAAGSVYAKSASELAKATSLISGLPSIQIEAFDFIRDFIQYIGITAISFTWPAGVKAIFSWLGTVATLTVSGISEIGPRTIFGTLWVISMICFLIFLRLISTFPDLVQDGLHYVDLSTHRLKYLPHVVMLVLITLYLPLTRSSVEIFVCGDDWKRVLGGCYTTQHFVFIAAAAVAFLTVSLWVPYKVGKLATQYRPTERVFDEKGDTLTEAGVVQAYREDVATVPYSPFKFLYSSYRHGWASYKARIMWFKLILLLPAAILANNILVTELAKGGSLSPNILALIQSIFLCALLILYFLFAWATNVFLNPTDDLMDDVVRFSTAVTAVIGLVVTILSVVVPDDDEPTPIDGSGDGNEAQPASSSFNALGFVASFFQGITVLALLAMIIITLPAVHNYFRLRGHYLLFTLDSSLRIPFVFAKEYTLQRALRSYVWVNFWDSLLLSHPDFAPPTTQPLIFHDTDFGGCTLLNFAGSVAERLLELKRIAADQGFAAITKSIRESSDEKDYARNQIWARLNGLDAFYAPVEHYLPLLYTEPSGAAIKVFRREAGVVASGYADGLTGEPRLSEFSDSEASAPAFPYANPSALAGPKTAASGGGKSGGGGPDLEAIYGDFSESTAGGQGPGSVRAFFSSDRPRGNTIQAGRQESGALTPDLGSYSETAPGLPSRPSSAPQGRSKPLHSRFVIKPYPVDTPGKRFVREQLFEGHQLDETTCPCFGVLRIIPFPFLPYLVPDHLSQDEYIRTLTDTTVDTSAGPLTLWEWLLLLNAHPVVRERLARREILRALAGKDIPCSMSKLVHRTIHRGDSNQTITVELTFTNCTISLSTRRSTAKYKLSSRFWSPRLEDSIRLDLNPGFELVLRCHNGTGNAHGHTFSDEDENIHPGDIRLNPVTMAFLPPEEDIAASVSSLLQSVTPLGEGRDAENTIVGPSDPQSTHPAELLLHQNAHLANVEHVRQIKSAYRKDMYYRFYLVKQAVIRDEFWLAAYESTLPRHQLERYLQKHEYNPRLRALPAEHKDGLDFLYARLDRFRANPTAMYWYAVWFDLFSNNSDLDVVQQNLALLSPQSPHAVCYRPQIARFELETLLSDLEFPLFRPGLFRASWITTRFLDNLYHNIARVSEGKTPKLHGSKIHWTYLRFLSN